MAEQRQLGRVGEEAAIQYLQAHGYRILERNYRCRFGEIDLIARDGAVLVFVEVKTRRSRAFGSPATAVTLQKQRHIVKASQVYLAHRGDGREVCRFDVVAIELDGHRPRIEIIKNAFQAAADLG
jgi:putative endonuclease